MDSTRLDSSGVRSVSPEIMGSVPQGEQGPSVTSTNSKPHEV